jgi:hypothetical protein
MLLAVNYDALIRGDHIAIMIANTLTPESAIIEMIR